MKSRKYSKVPAQEEEEESPEQQDIDNSNIFLPGIVKVLLKKKSNAASFDVFTILLCLFLNGLASDVMLDRVEFVDVDKVSFSWTQQQGSHKKLL